MNRENFRRTEYNTPFISQRADPYIYKHTDGTYYFTATVPEYDRIVLRSAGTIEELAHAKEICIWKKHEKGIMSTHIWAPELHYLGGYWYIYFAAGDMDNIWDIRPYVLECRDSNPLTGVWTEMGQMQGREGDEFSFRDFSLDATVFEHGKRWYCVWAEKVNEGKKISNLYIAELEGPNKLKTDQVLLTTPDYDWERIGFWVNEGPGILKHEKKLFLTYSASSTGSCYCVGMLSIDGDADLLDPRAWKKERYPVFRTDMEKGLFGPGHNCFVKNEDGSKDIMVYHARQYDEIIGDPLCDPNRHTYLKEVRWDSQGTPILG